MSFDPSAPSNLDYQHLKDGRRKPLYSTVCQCCGMHAVPYLITEQFMPDPSNKPDLDEHRLPMVQNPTGYRNPPASVYADSAFPAGSRNRPASVSTGRPFSASWRNHAAKT
ncbi:hypothetical protein Tco_0016259 [Tanacetum coccineum]